MLTEKKLFKKYPELFAQRKLPMTQTAMCWEIDISPGWYELLDSVCNYITSNFKNNWMFYPPIQFTQVKEKFGSLRIYYTINHRTKKEFDKLMKNELINFKFPKWKLLLDKYLGTSFRYNKYIDDCNKGSACFEGAIELAEDLSSKICEMCGQPGKLLTKGWYITLCDQCNKKRKKLDEKN